MSLAEAEPPDNSKKALGSPLLRNGATRFTKVDAAAAIALVGSGSGSGAALAPAPSFRTEHKHPRSPSRSTELDDQ
jgi:hypothetical protein